MSSGLLRDALARLGIGRLCCVVHDRCLPPDARFDPGCGAPGGDGAAGFLGFVKELGFDTVQLGPPGQVSLHNLSPYDGTVFSRSRLNLSWSAAVEAGLAPEPAHGAAEPAAAGRCDYPRAFAQARERWARLHAAWEQAGRREPRLDAFVAAAGPWLMSDARHDALSARFGTTDFRRWPAGAEQAAVDPLELERYAREQWLLHEQHQAFRGRARAEGLEVWADLQVGLSHADVWAHRGCLLQGYAMGAPPSRTNPLGQPWGYAVYDPARRAGARALLSARFSKLFAEYDGVRVDHPHGQVCPWVYREGERDPYAAVRAGGRLYSIGGRPELAALAAHDIARREQLDPAVAPWDDGFVRALEDDQVAAYAWAFDLLVEAAGGTARLACEVLSTVPYPLWRVMQRHGLGRFRVTGKADVTKSDDVYLLDNAAAADWVMPGTHDTPTLWRSAREWSDAVARARAAYAARRLGAGDAARSERLERHFLGSRDALAQGELALLFLGPPRHVLLWVGDVLGETGLYNRPGVVHPDNWTWRVAGGYRALHAERCARGAAFDPAASLALALAARPGAGASSDLVAALRARASAPVPQ